tara:strand:- start:4 stop:951 length:948 start_codon:yes stop_codon:yes gene_type:complete
MKMDYIDVTLRDGGHQINFDWPDNFVHSHLKVMVESPTINFTEIGYWKQTAKSNNKFYNFNENHLQDISEKLGLENCNKFSVMVDCHYCKHDINEYPNENFGLGLVRVCARFEDVERGIKLGENIKKRTGSKLGMNFSNITNYTADNLERCIKLSSNSGVNFIYFADSHGTLDLEEDYKKYFDLAEMVKSYGMIPGFHLHDHSGKAYFNYRNLSKCGFEITDISLSGMGKGNGNLKLENVIPVEENLKILDHLEEYRYIMTMKPSSYGIVSSSLSITDNYALHAMNLGIKPSEFYEKAQCIKGMDKDNYSKDVLI